MQKTKSATDALKNCFKKRNLKKTAEATGDLVGNNIGNKVTRSSSQSVATKSITLTQTAQTDETSIKCQYRHQKKNMYWWT